MVAKLTSQFNQSLPLSKEEEREAKIQALKTKVPILVANELREQGWDACKKWLADASEDDKETYLSSFLTKKPVDHE